MYEWDGRQGEDDEKESEMTELEKKWGSVIKKAEPSFQYKTINDAFALYGKLHSLMRGNTEIWYQKSAVFGRVNAKNINPDDLDRTHILLGGIFEKDLDDIFRVLQGDVWSPQGEARHLIRSKGLGHTSMSVGDVIVVGNKTFMVDRIGFTSLD
jgi:hypothetical protein